MDDYPLLPPPLLDEPPLELPLEELPRELLFILGRELPLLDRTAGRLLERLLELLIVLRRVLF